MNDDKFYDETFKGKVIVTSDELSDLNIPEKFEGKVLRFSKTKPDAITNERYYKDVDNDFLYPERFVERIQGE